MLLQSERGPLYAAAAERLLDRGLAYPCVCTRREVDTASSAPHGTEGPRYPGTCRGLWRTREEAEAATRKPAALRFVTPSGPVAFLDQLYGAQAFDPQEDTGDFVIFRNNGVAAYQLATVIDDAASGVDLVMRAADLLPSTSRQVLLQRALGLPTPAYLHLPLVVGADGHRLAKRHGDTSLRSLREQGLSAPALVGRLASTAGLCRPDEALTPQALLPRYAFERLDTRPVLLDASTYR